MHRAQFGSPRSEEDRILAVWLGRDIDAARHQPADELARIAEALLLVEQRSVVVILPVDDDSPHNSIVRSGNPQTGDRQRGTAIHRDAGDRGRTAGA